MAEALKTFREGEDILASETNENNQYLLSKLSDNAAQVQSYVEGEVATIKSNVASVQATLQNNIDLVKELVRQAYNDLMPDWNNKSIKDLKKEHTADANGYIVFGSGYAGAYNGDVKLYINGALLLSSTWGAAGLSMPFGSFAISKGDKYKVVSNCGGDLYFVPCKGEFKEEV